METFSYIEPLNINTNLVCKFCKKPLSDPIILVCGHLICCTCIPNELWIESGYTATCPECGKDYKKEDTTINIPICITEDLNGLKVKCNRCLEGVVINRVDFYEHIELYCKTPCELGCGAILTKNEIKSHLDVCSNFIVECPALDIYCKWKGPRKDLEEHIQKCNTEGVRPAIEALRESVQNLKEENQLLVKNLEKSNDILLCMVKFFFNPNDFNPLEGKDYNLIENINVKENETEKILEL
ncbi:hypothetical protein DICPUDRAFT_155616 [Dictyostelium purpureum]|uniref:RING-type domain-containing protein n=1 Tax=Dictyostelium purpureum TaxID=5786 RepID=F0ZUG7_DICPU|nr:uncharacterized protein DICPUDRAFT_155616 [Dictyostelium purpureum]EGC32418.1 hypothetical protein DICPUDRAFT_155616 [Dictyostelium purpureum]|eukprot:XP_003291065.1 hypothetical protein DICPUDRAFT_155616 [Dictyostelium purpureum]